MGLDVLCGAIPRHSLGVVMELPLAHTTPSDATLMNREQGATWPI